MENFDKYYNKCLHFLSFRPRSEKEIRDYLLKKKVASDIIEQIITKLKQYNFVNDLEFVKWWIEQRTLIKPKAWRSIKFELKQKGIRDDLLEHSEFEQPDDLETAQKLAEKKFRLIPDKKDKQKVREKLARYLSGKGFDWDTIKDVIDQYLPK